jgi:hypothetical protein
VGGFQTLLHPQNQVPSTLTPKEKSTSGPVPINNNFSSNPTPVQAPRTEFQPVPAPVMHNNRDRDNPVFSGKCQIVISDSKGCQPFLRLTLLEISLIINSLNKQLFI